jgi:hypothetical protein
VPPSQLRGKSTALYRFTVRRTLSTQMSARTTAVNLAIIFQVTFGPYNDHREEIFIFDTQDLFVEHLELLE